MCTQPYIVHDVLDALLVCMVRCASSAEAAAEVAQELPRLVPSTFAYSSSSSVQLAALQLAGQLLPRMPSTAAAAAFLLSQVPSFLQHMSSECRKQLEQLLENVWRRLDSEVQGLADPDAAAAARAGQQPQQHQLLTSYKQQVEAALFVLASDRSAAINTLAASFWHDSASVQPASGPAHTVLMPKNPVQRLAALLHQVSGLKAHLSKVWAAAGLDAALAEGVARDAEARWPCFAAALLLRLPREMSSTWRGEIFPRDLDKCEFTDYPVQTQASSLLSGLCVLGRANRVLNSGQGSARIFAGFCAASGCADVHFCCGIQSASITPFIGGVVSVHDSQQLCAPKV